jgi:ribosomal protein S27AE
MTAMPLVRGARKVIPNRPTCPCGNQMVVDSGKRFACPRCGMVAYRGKFQAGTPKQRRHKVELEVKSSSWWRCVKVNDLDPYRPGYRYAAQMVRQDIRANWLHKGTVFETPSGERVEVK